MIGRATGGATGGAGNKSLMGAGYGLRQAIGGGDVIVMDATAMSGRLEWGLIFSGVGGVYISAVLGYTRGEHG